MGATLAVRTALALCEATGQRKFLIKGDSSHVVSAVRSARLLSYSPFSRLPNATLWNELRAAIEFATAQGLTISFLWAPRRYNRQADELCNARFDGRDPNPLVQSSPAVPPQCEILLDKILARMCGVRFPCVRFLPLELALVWREVVYARCADESLPHPLRRKLFFVFPALLSVFSASLKNRSDFKKLRDHMCLLLVENYFLECLVLLENRLGEAPPAGGQKPATSTQKRAETLAARGLFTKILPQGKGVSLLAPEGLQERVRELFPQSPLPAPLPTPQGPPIELETSEIIEEIKKMKRGKSPGLSGWTRELLFPLVVAPLSSASRPFLAFLKSFFADVVACSLSSPERGLLQRGVLTLLGYENAPEKVRPIVVKETFLKVALRVCLRRFSLPPPPGSVFGRPGGASIGVPVAQGALDRGFVVVALDAENAFNTLNRAPVFALLKTHESLMSPLFPLLNLIYSEKNYACAFGPGGGLVFSQEITTGTAQGCVSGTHFLEWGKTPPLERLRASGILCPSVADDFFPFFREKDLDKIEIIIRELGKAGLQMNKRKTRIFCAREIAPPTFLAGCPVISSPSPFLGSVILPSPCRYENESDIVLAQFISAMMKTIEKNEMLLKAIRELDASLQIKMNILRATQWRNIFVTTTIPSSPFTSHIIEHIQNMYLEAFCQMFSLPNEVKESHHVRLFSPVEDGGVGLLPLTVLRPFLSASLVAKATSLASELGLDLGQATQHDGMGVKAMWRTVMKDKIKSDVNCEKMYNKSWMDEWPNRPLVKLDDNTCKFAIWYRLQLFYPKCEYQCVLTGKKIRDMSPSNAFKHIESCSSCGGIFFYLRHEKINNVIHKTFKYHNVPSECNPKDFPLPDNTRGGPDFLVFVGSKIYCGDVVVTKGKTGDAYRRKVRTYHSFCELTGFESFPFSISTAGKIDFKTISILKEIAMQSHSPFLLNDIVAHVQFELLRGMYAASSVLQARGLRIAQDLSLGSSPSAISITPPAMPSHSSQEVQVVQVVEEKAQDKNTPNTTCTEECEKNENQKNPNRQKKMSSHRVDTANYEVTQNQTQNQTQIQSQNQQQQHQHHQQEQQQNSTRYSNATTILNS